MMSRPVATVRYRRAFSTMSVLVESNSAMTDTTLPFSMSGVSPSTINFKFPCIKSGNTRHRFRSASDRSRIQVTYLSKRRVRCESLALPLFSSFPHMCLSSRLAYIFDGGSTLLSSRVHRYFLPFWSMCWPRWLCLGGHLQPSVSEASPFGSVLSSRSVALTVQWTEHSLQTCSGLKNLSKYKMMKKIRARFSEHKQNFHKINYFRQGTKSSGLVPCFHRDTMCFESPYSPSEEWQPKFYRLFESPQVWIRWLSWHRLRLWTRQHHWWKTRHEHEDLKSQTFHMSINHETEVFSQSLDASVLSYFEGDKYLKKITLW